MLPQSLNVADAAAAIIVLPGSRFLMQLRDDRPDIWYPAHWGCFGGALDPGETAWEALKRELNEELELVIKEARLESRYVFDFEPVHLVKICRAYYVVDLSDAELSKLVLHEGAAMEVLTYHQLTSGIPVTPYDAFALHFHYLRTQKMSSR